MTKIYNRSTKMYIDEPEYGHKQVAFIYNNVFGRFILWFIVSRHWFSAINALINRSEKSVSKIIPFIVKHNVNKDEFVTNNFKSFNDFFQRSLKKKARPIDKNVMSLISPADSKLLVYDIDNSNRINIKNSVYTLAELLANDEATSEYFGGLCLVFRLSVDDCHKYIYIDDGVECYHKTIKGRLHTVQPLKDRQCKSFSENYREYALLDLIGLGKTIIIEVGALLVGRINNKYKKRFSRGDQKGFFELGGSTIVLVINKKASVRIDSDIKRQSLLGIETKVKLGEKIGAIIND